MKKTLLSITIALTLSGCAAVGSGARYDDAMFTLRTNSIASVNQMAASVVAFLSTGTEEQVIEKAKTTVSNGLRDPGSAQFRNVRVVPYQIGKVVCGEVNGKNAYGGYVGFTAFVSGVNQSSMYNKEPEYPAIERASNTGLLTACGAN